MVIDWHIASVHVFSKLVLVVVIFNTCILSISVICVLFLIEIVVFMVSFNDTIAKFKFYANCRFSAVNGLISISYIAIQDKKTIVFKYPPYRLFKGMRKAII